MENKHESPKFTVFYLFIFIGGKSFQRANFHQEN